MGVLEGAADVERPVNPGGDQALEEVAGRTASDSVTGKRDCRARPRCVVRQGHSDDIVRES